MPFNTNHVTNTLLQRAFREGRSDMTPMKVQKMLFYTHGWHLAITGKAALDKPFEVWPWGPVIDTVYQELRHFGGSSVTSYIKESTKDGALIAYVVSQDNTQLYESLDVAWEKYIGISAMRLSAMTHEPGSPWDIARKEGNRIIPDKLVREYFVRLAATTNR